MPTLMPSHIAVPVPKRLNSENVVTALHPWRKQLFRQQTFRWLLRGINLGLIIACSVLLAARVFPWATALYWAIGLAIVASLQALVAAIWYCPSLARTVNVIDKRLTLHDRISTAWELREQTSALAELQRYDALEQLAKSKPATAFPLYLHRSTVLTLIGTTLMLALLIWFPNPMTAILKQQADLQAHVARQIASIEKTRRQIDAQSTIPSQEKQNIDQVLRDLEAALHNAKSVNEAQQDLADAQAKLDQLRNPQAVARIQSQSTAGQSLHNSRDANLQAIGEALANNDPQGLAQALQKLAAQASTLPQAQRDQLAQQLDNAANQSSQNPDLKSALHQLAQALTDKNAKQIANASHTLQATANQTATDQKLQTLLNQASQNLQNVANNLAAPTDNPNAFSQHQQGQAKGQGQQGQAKGQGRQGQGQGSSSVTKNGQGKNEQVYVPGQINQGSSAQSTNSSSSAVQSGDQVSYSQVIARYSQMAHDAIDNSNISPDDKDLVHDYFNSLAGK